MFCKFCGKPNEDGAKYCSSCGNDMEAEVAQNPVTEEQPAPVTETPVAATRKKTSGLAVASFVLSLVGLLVAAIICGTLGIIFASMAFKAIREQNLGGKGLATAGLVISICDIVLVLISFAL